MHNVSSLEEFVHRAGSEEGPEDSPQPQSYAGALLGMPHVALPVSQLALGRTTPPWNGMAWRAYQRCRVDRDMLRVSYSTGSSTSGSTGSSTGSSSASSTGGSTGSSSEPREPPVHDPGGCSFYAVPPCFPSEQVTLHFSVRFGSEWCWSCGFGGGRLPGLVAKGPDGWKALFATAWLTDGRLVAVVHSTAARPATLFGRSGLKLRGDGVWNDIVLRVKLSTRGGPNGEVSVSVNGAAARHEGSTWPWPAALVGMDVTTKCRSTKMPDSTHADFANFGVVV